MYDVLADVFEPINLDGFTDPIDLKRLGVVFSRLAAYADHKARGMELRQAGDIEAALAAERAAEHQYKNLPPWAVW